MGKLYLVPTPVGNLKDITLRAIETLKQVSLILAEDTRVSGRLLQHYQISTPMQSHHKFNEHQSVDAIVGKIKSGMDIALITDAGTPCISDPGFLLSRQCAREGIEIECLPGATAFVPALIHSALPSERFVFEGFLPDKKGRQTRLEEIKEEKRTMIFYVSPFKLMRTIEDFEQCFGSQRKASVCREISKMFQETKRGSLGELKQYFQDKTIKGEIVVVVAGKEKEMSDD